MFGFFKKAKYDAYASQLNDALNETLNVYTIAVHTTNSYSITMSDFAKQLRTYETIYAGWPAAEEEIRKKAANVIDLRMMTIIRNIKDMQDAVLATYRKAVDLQQNEEFIAKVNAIGNSPADEDHSEAKQELLDTYDFDLNMSTGKAQAMTNLIVEDINKEMQKLTRISKYA